MYNIVEIGGHQYKVSAGDLIDVQKLQADEGSKVELDKVLFVGGDNTIVGEPTVKGAKVVAHVIRHDKSRKVIVSKRRKGRWKRKNGHRQQYTALLITEVHNGNGEIMKIESDNKWATKYLGQK
ncbi:MAG: 50S ribosomal protein L21 [Bdellovibrionales bacterium RIFOXYB1_FULL_37_110]|nr:MAG: 50S ribosomal protein L21 [Bdellovibrionales bacterium RIFOXYC1_FULL_37_79]OFZ57981.1 MAG: 50S ribosomal protein L21 [Bdellovibrionales bacterium RIFOXYB1_FULL_37_110]OFZ61977.1 MAG: 50S ribosomal protein L21 [Bdellovibrionales bacterium RIFOXYB2_FULL_36_6]OFZ63118.1 MAG: 50S ribosomal protein L21 [Bdellovibrionales bacterium RIFOXYD1_FULL_36_51]